MASPLRLCVRRAPVTGPAGLLVEVSLRVPSDLGCVEETVDLVTRHCLAGEAPSSRLRFRLRVVLAEALANAIIAGNGEDPSKWVELRAELTDELVRIHVTDQGPGFDHTAIPAPIRPEDLECCSGRGLFLIRQLADEVRFNEKGNSICMTLRRR
ncbi:MAG TPA: ATP-binding protein [Gemmatimonadales bacterium]|nr:ATP-binding protein [Gemmatimonadales bacterium]